MSLQQKQQFLCEEIIDGNYSPEEFQVFLETKKPQAGIDLNLWPLDELRQVVKVFKSSHKPIGKTEVPPPPPPSPPPPPPVPHKQTSGKESNLDDKKSDQQHEVKSSQSKLNSVRGENEEIDSIDPISGEDHYVKFVTGIKVEPLITDNHLSVVMRKFEKNEGGLFQQDYVSYCIETPQKNWVVNRRYNEFVWLRQTLEKMFPGLPIPPIPKKGHFRNFEESHLHRRMNALENFLNKMLAMPQLGSCGIVIGFIRISEGGEYLKYKKDFTIEEARVPQNKLQTAKGVVRLAIEPKMAKLYTQFRQTFAVSEQKLNKIYRDSKAIFGNLEQSAKLMEGLGGTFMELSEQSARFMKAAEITPDKTTGAQLYRTMGSLTRDLSKLMAQEAQAFKQHMYGLYKYEMHSMVAMNDTLKRLDEAKEEYTQFKQKLRKTKDKYIEDRNYNKWGLPLVQSEKLAKDKNAYPRQQLLAMMLPKETQQQAHLRDHYALLNATFHDEIIRYFRDNPLYLTRNLLEFSRKESNIISAVRHFVTQQIMLWADVLSLHGKISKLAPLASDRPPLSASK